MRRRILLCMLVCCLLIVAGVIGLLVWGKLYGGGTYAEQRLADGSVVSLAVPGEEHGAPCAIAATEEHFLDAARLSALADRTGRRLAQFTLKAGESQAEQKRRFAGVLAVLGRKPQVVAGMDAGAAFAYRWLAGQDDDTAVAVSSQFSLSDTDCQEPLPNQIQHGLWRVFWNNDPDDPTGVFIRSMPQDRVETTIGNYSADAVELLLEALPALASDRTKRLPVVELPAGNGAEHADTVILFYSGDGGWRDLDKTCGEYMAAHGYPVVGVDCLKLFWQHKSPEQSAGDLAWLMHYYRKEWGAKRFVLAGYSFGADILPVLYNKLSVAEKESIAALILLAFSPQADFEIAVSGWLGGKASEMPTAPDLALVPAQKIFCVYGEAEADESGCRQVTSPGETYGLPGGHHFDEDYPKLARIMMDAIRKRL